MKELGFTCKKRRRGKRCSSKACKAAKSPSWFGSHTSTWAIFAYRESCNLNLQHKLQQSRRQYAMLRKVIHAKRIISKQHRYRVWMARVFTSATYGIYTVGLTINRKTQLKAMVSGQLRATALLPAHPTHVTNSEVREQLGFKDSLQQLHDQARKHLEKLEELQLQMLQPEHMRATGGHATTPRGHSRSSSLGTQW